jgi:hypothetical protein
MKGGHLLLAIPTVSFYGGEAHRGFAIFAFDPAKNYHGNCKGRVYFGTISTGGDNSASCDSDTGGPKQCFSNTGKLEFVAPVSGAMPGFRVPFSGWTVSDAGKARPLGSSDAATYFYDTSTKRYAPPLDF